MTNIHYSMKRVKRDSLDHRKEIQTKYPEIWKELMNARRSWCFVKVMKLHPDHLFGLSDYLYNIKREQEQMFTDNTRLGESSSLEMDPLDDEDPGGELAEPAPSVFYMICTSYRLECYCINKVAYFKHMLAFATDKTIINHYLDQLVNQFRLLIKFFNLNGFLRERKLTNCRLVNKSESSSFNKWRGIIIGRDSIKKK